MIANARAYGAMARGRERPVARRLAARPGSFNRAAAQWESFISDPIQVTISADLAPLARTLRERAETMALEFVAHPKDASALTASTPDGSTAYVRPASSA